jgi:hypothetical protein
MTRRVRLWLGLSILLLGVTDTVYAECAWVLWQHGYQFVGQSTTSVRDPVGAYLTKDECERALAQRRQEMPNAATRSTWFACLPDTIDPRSPKQ